MINIQFNGEPFSFNATMTLAELLQQQQPADQPFAVAINQTFVPRSQYDRHRVEDGDSVELVVPMQGG